MKIIRCRVSESLQEQDKKVEEKCNELMERCNWLEKEKVDTKGERGTCKSTDMI